MLALRGRAVAQTRFVLIPGQVFWSVTPDLFDLAMMAARPEVTRFSPAAAIDFAVTLERPLEVEGTAAEDTLVLPITEDVLLQATRASTSFAKSADLTPLIYPGSLYDFFLHKYPRATARHRAPADGGT